jgi:hypothetical protein
VQIGTPLFLTQTFTRVAICQNTGGKGGLLLQQAEVVTKAQDS